jgi:hypothetical protein
MRTRFSPESLQRIRHTGARREWFAQTARSPKNSGRPRSRRARPGSVAVQVEAVHRVDEMKVRRPKSFPQQPGILPAPASMSNRPAVPRAPRAAWPTAESRAGEFADLRKRARSRTGYVSEDAIEGMFRLEAANVRLNDFHVFSRHQLAQQPRTVRVQLQRDDTGSGILRGENPRFPSGGGATIENSLP